MPWFAETAGRVHSRPGPPCFGFPRCGITRFPVLPIDIARWEHPHGGVTAVSPCRFTRRIDDGLSRPASPLTG